MQQNIYNTVSTLCRAVVTIEDTAGAQISDLLSKNADLESQVEKLTKQVEELQPKPAPSTRTKPTKPSKPTVKDEGATSASE